MQATSPPRDAGEYSDAEEAPTSALSFATTSLSAADREAYRVALDAVSEGICYFDAEDRLILCNKAYASMYRLEAKDVPRGATLREIAERRDLVRASPMPAEQYVGFAKAINLSRKVKVWDAPLLDGRTIRVRHQPMPNGGFVATHQDITELVESRVIAHERVSLQALIDAVPDYLWVKDLDSRFVIVNDAVARDHGRETSSELIGLSDFDIHARELAEGFRALEKQVMETGEPMVDREEWLVHASGARKCVLSRKMPLRNYRGEVIGLVGVARDITARKQECALHDGEAELLQMIASREQPSVVLEHLAELIESQIAGSRVAVLGIGQDGASLRRMVAPHLPEDYARALGMIRLPSNATPVAAAASYREVVNVADASPSGIWRQNFDWAATHDLPTCWSAPIDNRHGGICGVIVVYSALRRAPDQTEANLIQVAACLAGFAMETGANP